MANKTGIKSKLYIRTSGSFASPTWTEVSLIGDAKIEGDWSTAKAITRETPVERVAKTSLPLAVSGKIRVQDDNSAYVSMDNAWAGASTDGTADVMVLNGGSTTNGVTGVRFEAEVTGWSEDQAVGNVLFKDFKLEPAITSNLPKRVVVSGGAAVFSNFA